MVTVAAVVDLSAAYDAVNHMILIKKVYENTKDSNSAWSFRICCQAEYYMWHRTINESDGETRGMACPKEVSFPQYGMISTLTIIPYTLKYVT